jgi:acetate kinase
MFSLLTENGLDGGIDAAGHRVVHGGARFTGAVEIGFDVIEGIEAVTELAPLHNGPALATIKACRDRFARVPMVAVFDTAFFAALPPVATTYGIPAAVARRHSIRRYGFHGLAHSFMAETVAALSPAAAARLVSFQLGSGCSAAAIRNGKPIDASMGFTPLEGLLMGTRPGDIDPGVLLYLMDMEGLDREEASDLLNEQSGLLGISGSSPDMRQLEKAAAAGDRDAALAIDVFCYRAVKYAGAYFAALGGATAIAFGGGIGEHSATVRGRICRGLEWAGLLLDEGANASTAQGARCISAAASSIEAWVVPVDEESVIAREAAACLEAR